MRRWPTTKGQRARAALPQVTKSPKRRTNFQPKDRIGGTRGQDASDRKISPVQSSFYQKQVDECLVDKGLSRRVAIP